MLPFAASNTVLVEKTAMLSLFVRLYVADYMYRTNLLGVLDYILYESSAKQIDVTLLKGVYAIDVHKLIIV